MSRRACLVALVALTALGLIAPAARAGFGFVPGSVTIAALDSQDHPDYRAGSHPDHLTIDFDFQTKEEKIEGNVRDFAIDLPPGLVADGNAVPVCPRRVFDGEECPTNSQVGVVTVKFANGEEEELAVSSIEPAPGGATEIGSSFLVKLPVVTHLRSADSGVTLTQTDTTQSLAMAGVEFELWGVPADHQSATSLPRLPFITLPTDCTRGLSISLRARSWQEPDVWQRESSVVGAPLQGCDGLGFDPKMALKLASPLADSPTGVDIDLSMPANVDPDGRAAASIRDVKLTLPEGMSLSPGGAQSLASCGDAEFGLGSETPPACPPGSRVGTIEVVSPVLKDPVTGGVYVGEERPGERFRMLAVIEALGAQLKLVGLMSPNPKTGQLTFEMHGVPRIPFTRMTFHFNGGARALLVTPLSCGPATASATFSAYGSGATAAAQAGATVAGSAGEPCAGKPPFAATFSAGTNVTRAGRDTDLAMTLRRRDGEELAERFEVTLPAGLAAGLGTVETCAAAAAATGGCPAASRIGSALAEIGSGSVPAALAGDVYLTGPHREAPYGIAMVFDAKLGPFDLGPLVVRGAIGMDLREARITIESDPLPRVVAGVPIRFQTFGLDLDRPGFVSNPTSCRPSRFETSVRAVDGRISAARTPFAVRGCESLRFRPSVSLGILGSRLDRGEPVGLRVGLRMPGPGTNLRGMSIPLPEQLAFELGQLDEVCAQGDVLEGECPAGARVGGASARTPLLSKRLRGSVYLVQPSGNGLPDLWTVLEGQGLQLAIRVKTSSRHGRTTANLIGVPDLPMTNLSMKLATRGSGVISLRHGLCGGAHPRSLASTVGVEGQSGAYRLERVPVRHRPCGAKPPARPQRQRLG